MRCNFVNTKTRLIGFTSEEHVTERVSTDYSAGKILAAAYLKTIARWKRLWRGDWHHRALTDINWEQKTPSNEVTGGSVLGRTTWKTIWIAIKFNVNCCYYGWTQRAKKTV